MFICTDCKSHLPHSILSNEQVSCPVCSKTFFRTDGFLVFIDPDSFDSEYGGMKNDMEFLKHEDYTTRKRFQRYFIPLFKELNIKFDARILCLGCGGGGDVDVLHKSGFPYTYGIEIGWRTFWWKSRNGSSKHLFCADGRNLPFDKETFDIIISLGVIEHVGAVGTTSKLYSDYENSRVQFIGEAVRTLKKNGRLILACPNRTFPFDFQHNISKSKFFMQMAAKTGISVHSPFNNLLLSYQDVRKHALSVSNDLKLSPLPVYKYLGLNFYNSPKLKPFSKIFDNYLFLLDKFSKSMRMSFLNPYMICELKK